MRYQELLDQVKKLDKENKLKLLRELLHDPDMREYAFDPLGIRTNHEAAHRLQEMLDRRIVESQPET